jgi:hypothetical protein
MPSTPGRQSPAGFLCEMQRSVGRATLGVAEHARYRGRDILFEIPETFLNDSRLSRGNLPKSFAGKYSANTILIVEARNEIWQESAHLDWEFRT